jgi:hypothetical protein
MATSRTQDWIGLVRGVTGPVAIGVVVGWRSGLDAAEDGVRSVGEQIALLAGVIPAVILGVALVTVPALYIGQTLAGRAPPAVRVVAAARKAVDACGTVCLGLAAPLAFLVATAPPNERLLMLFLAELVVGCAVIVALLRMRRELYPEKAPIGAGILYWGWASVAALIGGRLLETVLQRVTA